MNPEGPQQTPPPDPDSTPQADPLDQTQDASALLPHALEESYEALIPPFERYCQDLGRKSELSPGEVVLAEMFRVQVLELFGRGESKRGALAARDLAAVVIEEWGSRRSIIIAAEFVNADTGHSALPLSMAVDDEAKLATPRFWKGPNQEEFVAPAGVFARLRPEDGMVDLEPVFSGAALREAVDHARVLGRHLSSLQRREPTRHISEFGAGSLIFAMLCYKLQQSHEQADREVPQVEGPLAGDFRGREELSQSPILGVRRFTYAVAPHEHEIGVVALDTRSASIAELGVPGSALVVGVPLVEKVYRFQQPIEGPVLAEPSVKSVWIAPANRSN